MSRTEEETVLIGSNILVVTPKARICSSSFPLLILTVSQDVRKLEGLKVSCLPTDPTGVVGR